MFTKCALINLVIAKRPLINGLSSLSLRILMRGGLSIDLRLRIGLKSRKDGSREAEERRNGLGAPGCLLAGRGLIDCGSVDVDFEDDALYSDYTLLNQ